MKKFIFGFLFFVILGSSTQTHASSKNKETYEYLDLFGKIFDRVRSKYVDEVADKHAASRKSRRSSRRRSGRSSRQGVIANSRPPFYV